MLHLARAYGLISGERFKIRKLPALDCTRPPLRRPCHDPPRARLKRASNMFPGTFVTNLRRRRTQASSARGLNFGKADLENYSVTRERLLRRDERFLGGWYVRSVGKTGADRRSEAEERFLSEPGADVTVCLYESAVYECSSHRYEDGKLLENFPSVGTTYSDVSIEPLSRATPRTSSFPRLKFSIFVSVYVSSLSSSSSDSLRPRSFHPTPFTAPSRLSRPTAAHHPRLGRCSSLRALANSRPMKARNFQRRKTSS